MTEAILVGMGFVAGVVVGAVTPTVILIGVIIRRAKA